MSIKIRVGVIYGGKSGEHEVSLQTAISVINALDRNQYEIVPMYITKQGEWRTGKAIEAPVETKEQLLFAQSEAKESSALMPLFQRRELYRNEVSHDSPSSVDVILPLLHGTYGEDGTVQGLLEMAGVPYVGAGVLASAVSMDKIMMKKIFSEAGFPQCLFRYFTRTQWEENQDFYIMEIEVSLGYPCFVKPANLGSSVGISKVHNRDELMAAVVEALRYDRKVIVEEGVEGREVEVGVLGNERPKASVPGEIVSSGEFYDYRAKYIDGKSAMIIPAELSEEKTKELQEMAILAFQAVDGSGLSRIDFFVRHHDEKIMINEINTMPGFTPYSMYPLLWKESGLAYGQLLNELIGLAIERHEEKQKIEYGFNELN